jgi:hypothetical protein
MYYSSTFHTSTTTCCLPRLLLPTTTCCLPRLLLPTATCSLPRLPATSHDYCLPRLLPPTATCSLPRLPATSHDYCLPRLLPPTTTASHDYCLPRLLPPTTTASHDYCLPRLLPPTTTSSAQSSHTGGFGGGGGGLAQLRHFPSNSTIGQPIPPHQKPQPQPVYCSHALTGWLNSYEIWSDVFGFIDEQTDGSLHGPQRP